MKEKIKKIIFLIAEIGTVVWAINGIILQSRSCSNDAGTISLIPEIGGPSCEYHLPQILAYFLSAVLIIYLLRKYERKN